MTEAALVGHEQDPGDLAAMILTIPGRFPPRKGAVLTLEADGKGTVTRLEEATGD